MIRHIARIANTTREYDLGYGFLLTLVFEHFEVGLQKKMGVQVTDEIGSSTLLRCGFKLAKREPATSEQGIRITFSPVPGSSTGGSSHEAVLQDQSQLKAELSEVKATLPEENAVNATRDEDLLAALSALTVKLSPPPP